MSNQLKTARVLCSLKNTLLYNQLILRAGIGKIAAFAFVVILCVWAVADFFSDASTKLLLFPFGEQLLAALFAFTILFLLFITFTGDLTSGHTINMGQMSTDFDYLQTLPIKPMSIILLKLYERLLNDYFGILIMFSSFMGILCRDGFTFQGLALATVLFLHFSTLVGLAINLLMIFLTRFLKKSTINNLFSIIGYLSAFLTLVPVILLNNQSQRLLTAFASLYDSAQTAIDLAMAPFLWVAHSLLLKAFTLSYLKFCAFWLLFMLLGIYFYAKALNNAWYSYSHSSRKARTPRKYFPARLPAIFCKELTLLKSDLSLFVNALLLPLTIIIFEVYMVKTVFAFKTVPSILNLMFATIIYFSLFGPINAIGSEGRAISLLEALPITPSSIIWNKFLLWFAISELFFVSATFAVFKYLRFTTFIAFKSSLVVAVFTALSVFMAVCLSAIYANYKAKVVFQGSFFMAKILCLVFMLVLVPVKFYSTKNVISFSLFLLLLFLIWQKATRALDIRLDKEKSEIKIINGLNLATLFVFYFASVITLYQFVDFIVPGMSVGHWPWSLALAAALPYGAVNLQPR